MTDIILLSIGIGIAVVGAVGIAFVLASINSKLDMLLESAQNPPAVDSKLDAIREEIATLKQEMGRLS